MSDHEKPAWITWEIETARAKINADPRAALLAEFFKIRAKMLAELEVLWAQMEAELRAKRAAELAKQAAEMQEWAEWRAKRKAEMEKLEEKWCAIQRLITPHAVLH
jgi:hypothetical protein